MLFGIRNLSLVQDRQRGIRLKFCEILLFGGMKFFRQSVQFESYAAGVVALYTLLWTNCVTGGLYLVKEEWSAEDCTNLRWYPSNDYRDEVSQSFQVLEWKWYDAPLQHCIKEVLVESNDCSYVVIFSIDLELEQKRIWEVLQFLIARITFQSGSEWILKGKLLEAAMLKKLY